MKVLICILLIVSQVYCGRDFSSQEYQSKTRREKLDLLWNAVIENTQSLPNPNLDQFINGFFKLDMAPSLNLVSDIMPEGRVKFTHPVGTVGKAEFIPEPNNGYLGLLQGSDSVLIRLSLGGPADYSRPQAQFAKGNFNPTIALKFLIDGKPSANLVAFFSGDGVDSFNYFDKDMTTHLIAAQGPISKKVAEHFATAAKTPRFTGVRKMTENNQDGTQNKDAKYPFKVTFRAPKEVKALFTNDFTVEYTQTFSQIPIGTTLLDVYVTQDPETGCEQKVGTIKTTSKFTTSMFGDANLFFQHQDFILDLNNHPEWTAYTPFFTSAVCHLRKGENKIIATQYNIKPEGGCPFGIKKLL